MEKIYLFDKPLDYKLSNKKLLISLLILIVVFFPIIIVLGAILPLFKR
jgi:hypothetical protein